jgi:hypothetical protein
MKYSPDTPRATADPTMPHGARAGADTGAGAELMNPAEDIPVKIITEATANNDVFIFLLL